jgi:exopolysaccharide biosynthesis protein
MAQMMADASCISAYNLDGGQSSEMVYDGEFVNQPSKGGRDVSDIIYVGEE